MVVRVVVRVVLRLSVFYSGSPSGRPCSSPSVFRSVVLPLDRLFSGRLLFGYNRLTTSPFNRTKRDPPGGFNNSTEGGMSNRDNTFDVITYRGVFNTYLCN